VFRVKKKRRGAKRKRRTKARRGKGDPLLLLLSGIVD
jgi:hypothetical protein